MKHGFHILLGCCLALTACDEKEKPQSVPADDSRHQSRRPPREAPPGQRKNLRASLNDAAVLTDPVERGKVIAEIAWNAAELDPELAREAFGKLETDSPERLLLARHFAMRMAEEDPEQAINWSATLESEMEIAAARGQVALVISETDPQRAANLLSETGIAGHEFDVAAVQVLDRWADKAPSDAAAWVLLFPEGESREAGLKAVVSRWAETDSKTMFSWISGLPDGDIRNEARQAAADLLGEMPPENRGAWLEHADAATRNAIQALINEEGGN